MTKRFDHPEEVSVHLVSAMGCCDSSPSTQSNHLISALKNQKSVLQTQLRILEEKCSMLPSLTQLADEVHYLEQIIYRFDHQNVQAQKLGMMNVDNVAERLIKIQTFESGRALNQQALEKQYLLEMENNRQLNMEIEDVILKIKLLHQSNNSIVRNFGH